MASKEAQARIKINRFLEDSGWRFFKNEQGEANIVCESRVTKKKYKPDDLGNDFEKVTNGFIDYLLLNTDKRPLAVVEAKRECINPLDGKEQAREYAKGIGVRYIFLSNGNLHYYWDLWDGNPVRISKFLTNEQLGKAIQWTPQPDAMAAQKIDENYIAVSQDSQWLTYSPERKKTESLNKGIRILRDYQIAGVKKFRVNM